MPQQLLTVCLTDCLTKKTMATQQFTYDNPHQLQERINDDMTHFMRKEMAKIDWTWQTARDQLSALFDRDFKHIDKVAITQNRFYMLTTAVCDMPEFAPISKLVA